MRSSHPLFLLVLALVAMPLPAQDLASTCHTSSSYDVTINPDDLVFDRPSPAPLRVDLRQGALRVDGVAVERVERNAADIAVPIGDVHRSIQIPPQTNIEGGHQQGKSKRAPE